MVLLHVRPQFRVHGIARWQAQSREGKRESLGVGWGQFEFQNFPDIGYGLVEFLQVANKQFALRKAAKLGLPCRDRGRVDVEGSVDDELARRLLKIAQPTVIGTVSAIRALRMMCSAGRNSPEAAAMINTTAGPSTPLTSATIIAQASTERATRSQTITCRRAVRSAITPATGDNKVPPKRSAPTTANRNGESVSTRMYQARISVSISNPHVDNTSADHWKR